MALEDFGRGRVRGGGERRVREVPGHLRPPRRREGAERRREEEPRRREEGRVSRLRRRRAEPRARAPPVPERARLVAEHVARDGLAAVEGRRRQALVGLEAAAGRAGDDRAGAPPREADRRDDGRR